ncbi:MAG: RecX family transcriptional regulator, partial [Gammaproteobacteria bacterium]|nr:RecX family transcriptional regulator [Gammaproteobacteria bacterium]
DWYELALDLAQRKCPGGLPPQDMRERARLYRFLAYRGFTGEQTSYALEQLAMAEHSDND